MKSWWNFHLFYAAFCFTAVNIDFSNAQRGGRWSYGKQNASNQTGIYDTSTELLKTLFTNYLDSVPKIDERSGALKVRVNGHILRLLDVDELRQVLSISAKVAIEWRDNRLTWNPMMYSNLSKLEVPSSVPLWWPDLTWLERLEVDFSWRSQGRVMLRYDGLMTLSSQVIMNINCYMDPGYFPFDSHACTLTFEPLVHTKEEVQLITHLSEGIHNQSLFNDQWMCSVRNSCIADTHVYAQDASRTVEFSKSECQIKLRRRSLYHIFNLFLPATVITFMTVFAFLIPPTEPDMKIQFALAILLQLIVFLMYIYDSLPISATRIPLLSLYFALCLIMAATSCMLVVIIAYINWLGEDNISVPKKIRKIFIVKLGPCLIRRHLKVLDQAKTNKRASVVSAPGMQNNSVAGISGNVSANARISGIFRLGKIAVPLSVMNAQLDTSQKTDDSRGEGTIGNAPPNEPEAVQMLPDSDASNARVRFSTSGNGRGAVQAEPDALSSSLRRQKDEENSTEPSMTSFNEQEWNYNKIQWSLIALVLDRLCAIIFITIFTIIILVILVVGNTNSSSSM